MKRRRAAAGIPRLRERPVARKDYFAVPRTNMDAARPLKPVALAPAARIFVATRTTVTPATAPARAVRVASEASVAAQTDSSIAKSAMCAGCAFARNGNAAAEPPGVDQMLIAAEPASWRFVARAPALETASAARFHLRG